MRKNESSGDVWPVCPMIAWVGAWVGAWLGVGLLGAFCPQFLAAILLVCLFLGALLHCGVEVVPCRRVVLPMVGYRKSCVHVRQCLGMCCS